MAGERVLIVEDNEKNMKLVRDILQAIGYSPSRRPRAKRRSRWRPRTLLRSC